MNTEKTIVFCLPGLSYSGLFLQRWTTLVAECIKRGYKPLIAQTYNAVVNYSRMLCLGGDNLLGEDQKPFNGKIDYDYIMWIDDDVIFEPEDFFKLLESPHEVTAGLYHTKDKVHFPVVLEWNEEILHQYGKFPFINDEVVKQWKENKGRYMPVEYAGMGFFLMKKGAIEKIKFPWFYREHTKFVRDGKQIVIPLSEDVSFCKNLKDAGVNVIVDTDVIVGHYKSYVV